MLSESEIERRFPVWNALSDLFLDTELDEVTHKHISRVIIESGYEPDQIHNILWKEVFPAVGDNLRVVAGEWAGFNPEWLKERILAVKAQDSFTLANVSLISEKALIDITKQEWLKVCSYLPSNLSEPLLKASDETPTKNKVKLKKWWHLW